MKSEEQEDTAAQDLVQILYGTLIGFDEKGEGMSAESVMHFRSVFWKVFHSVLDEKGAPA